MVRWKAPEGIHVQEIGKADNGKGVSARRHIEVALAPTSRTQDLKHGKLLLWLEDEPEPLEVRLIVQTTQMEQNRIPD